MLAEAKRLYSLGFGILWLHPKEKRPIDSGWASGPRKMWSALEKQFKPGMNMGVRLGSASKIGGDKYLAVIDCDVKSTDARHQKEMVAAVRALFPDLDLGGPRVVTGRGNGSCHIYVATKAPAQKCELAKSGEVVKVKMPSAGVPSKREKAELSSEELAAGWRLRAAWEISFMGDGQQVVLPPSVHPDSGACYRWFKPLGALQVVTAAPATAKRAESPKKGLSGGFKVVDVGAAAAKLPERARALWEGGDGGTGNRSDDLYRFCIAAFRAGLSDDEILTLTTERGTYVGEVAYAPNHRNTSNRQYAGSWVRDYTMVKARERASGAHDFTAVENVEDIAEPKLSDADAVAQEKELTEKDPDGLDVTKEGAIKNTTRNVKKMLVKAFGPNIFRLNDFSGRYIHGVDTPWAKKDSELKDKHVVLAMNWFSELPRRFEPSLDRIQNIVTIVGEANIFHPVRDYLDSLVWDGRPRIDTWLKDFLNVTGAPEPYLAEVSSKTLVAMVARIFEPGVHYDTVLVIEGDQGIRKSTSLRALASDPWFTDSRIDIHDKDSVGIMAGRWLVEMGEITTIRANDVEDMKAFLSRRTDRMRPPYGRLTEDFPRQCILVGTTNQNTYLRDPTGERRFWPVKAWQCDVEGIAAARDQLWAEARWRYLEGGEYLMHLSPEAERQARIEQDKRTLDDSVREDVLDYLNALRELPEAERKLNPDAFTLAELLGSGATFANRTDQAYQNRIASIIKKAGYSLIHKRIRGIKRRLWVTN
jgi:predicted P-loop ATPase